MKHYQEREASRFPRQQWNEGQHGGFSDSSHNYGSDSDYRNPPYGERYGEDTHYRGGYDYDRGQRHTRESEFSPYRRPIANRDDSPGRSHRSDFSPRGYGSAYWRDSRAASAYDDYYDSENRISRKIDDRSWSDRTTDEVSSRMGDKNAEHRRREDEPHRGKGPKNYKRSDDRIKDELNDRLTDDWDIDASEIEVTVKNGEATLAGTVNDRSQKRKAEDLAENISGVTNVENRLRIAPFANA